MTDAERVAQLEAAIRKHRDDMCDNPRAEWLEWIDIELWHTLKETT